MAEIANADGLKLEAQGDLNGALAKYREADALVHGNTRFRTNIQRVLLAINVREAMMINHEGITLSRSGDLEGALRKYQEAAKLDPTNALIQRNIESVQRKIDDKKKEASLNKLADNIGKTASDTVLEFEQVISQEPSLLAEPAADLVKELNKIARLPIYENHQTHEFDSPLPLGKPDKVYLAKIKELNCQTFFRALGNERAEQKKPSWDKFFPMSRVDGRNADKIIEHIDEEANEKSLAYLLGLMKHEWRKVRIDEVQVLANKGIIVIGGLRRSNGSNGHLMVASPIPENLNMKCCPGSGPFVRDGNEHSGTNLHGQKQIYAATYGAVRASEAVSPADLVKTQWYVFTPSESPSPGLPNTLP